MKRCLITALLLVAVAIPVAAGQGATKIPFDPDVGWVVLNATATNRLIATVHLDDGLPDEEFSVSLRVRHEDQTVEVFADIATLTTNGQGKGNVQVQVDVHPPAGATTLRRIAVRVRRAPDPLYLAVAWDLPLR